jgi:hypothetical protein
LPEGLGFFCAAVLALLERVGWDADLRYQMELLAQFVGVQVDELEAVAAQLSQQGLLIQLGRYRAISPHPLAVFLAADVWRREGVRLVAQLVPALDGKMATAFFKRVADLGRFEPAQGVLSQLLAPGGPFGSLATIEERGLGPILTELAIVLPDQMALHLRELFESSNHEELARSTRSRRDLVWTLEKLVWHSRTFGHAADCLLQLSLAENETYSNNATGTWIGLFAVLLPATAARPTDRADYLRRAGRSPDGRVRSLVVKAASAALTKHESVAVFGELQGGVLVEPRGTPKTRQEAADYLTVLIDLLSALAAHDDETTSAEAQDALVGALHPLIDNPLVGTRLTDALLVLDREAMQRVRTEVAHLLGLYSNRSQDDTGVRERLEEFAAKLPSAAPRDEVLVLGQLRRWDFPEGELERRMVTALSNVSAPDRAAVVREALSRTVPAAWELGYAAASLDESSLVGDLLDAVETNQGALLGYLGGRHRGGNNSAFDEFLASDLASRLTDRQQVTIAARGPVTPQSRERILATVRRLPVADAVAALFGWHRNLESVEIEAALDDWLQRITDQRDYNALLDWVALLVHDEVPSESILDQIWALVQRRNDFPEVGQEGWDWAVLAGKLLPERAGAVGSLIVELIDTDKMMIHEGDSSAELLSACAAADISVWHEVAARLTRGSWRLKIEVAGWFLDSVSAAAVHDWVADDVHRARIVGGIVPVSGSRPSDLVRFLLDRFPTDEEIRGSLFGTLRSGTWWGNESDRITTQLAQLSEWRASPEEPIGVRKWAAEAIAELEELRRHALQREAEEST